MDTSFARTWLRLEGFATLLAAALFYQWFNLPWGWFALLFLAPDLAMLGYLAGAARPGPGPTTSPTPTSSRWASWPRACCCTSASASGSA